MNVSRWAAPFVDRDGDDGLRNVTPPHRQPGMLYVQSVRAESRARERYYARRFLLMAALAVGAMVAWSVAPNRAFAWVSFIAMVLFMLRALQALEARWIARLEQGVPYESNPESVIEER